MMTNDLMLGGVYILMAMMLVIGSLMAFNVWMRIIPAQRRMVAAAREVIAVVDHTKWERAAFATFCATDQLSIVLTDEQAPEAMVRTLVGRGIDVRLVGSDAGVAADADRHSGAARPAG